MADQAIIKIDLDLSRAKEDTRKMERRRERRGGIRAASGKRLDTRGVSKKDRALIAALPSPGDRPAKRPLRERLSGARARAGKLKSKAGRFASFATGGLGAGLRSVPLVGGALAATYFAALNAEKLAFVRGAAPELTETFGGAAVSQEALRQINVNVKAASETLGNVSDIGKAFAAIGEPPPGDALGELVPTLFKANRAQAIFQFDIKEELYRSAGSTVREAISQNSGADFMKGLTRQLKAQSYK